jgi:hypothetical protein
VIPVIASEAKQSRVPSGFWIASSFQRKIASEICRELLAMTATYRFDFFAVFFFPVFFFAVFRFFEAFFGTFLPLALASDSPIAIACLRLLTFFPDRPLFNVPALRFFITRSTSLEAFFEYLRAIAILRLFIW